jgi:hypothetical protein
MTALESLIFVAVCAALGWVAARVVVWSIDRLVQRRRALDGARGLAARCKAGRTAKETRAIIAGAVADGAIERAK